MKRKPQKAEMNIDDFLGEFEKEQIHNPKGNDHLLFLNVMNKNTYNITKKQTFRNERCFFSKHHLTETATPAEATNTE
jgi:hypothetical protein